MRVFLMLVIVMVTGLAFAKDSALNGEMIYQDHCAKCHSGGLGAFFSKAPTLKKPSAWEEYLEKGESRMVKNVMKGTSKMKPKGGCKVCTQEGIEDAVRFVVDELEAYEQNASKT